MLVLTRRPGEKLYLGDGIKLTVLSIHGKQVKLGLDVPADVQVYREEVYEKIKEETRLSVSVPSNDLLEATELWKTQKK